MNQGQFINCGDFKAIKDETTKHLICCFCNKIFRQPVRLYTCGHTFCKLCCLNTQECTNCKTFIDDIQQDLTAHNLILDIMVSCNLSKECPFKGNYDSFLRQHKDKCYISKAGGMNQYLETICNSLKQSQIKKSNHQEEYFQQSDFYEQRSQHYPKQNSFLQLENNLNNNYQIIDLQNDQQLQKIRIEGTLNLIKYKREADSRRFMSSLLQREKRKRKKKQHIYQID